MDERGIDRVSDPVPLRAVAGGNQNADQEAGESVCQLARTKTGEYVTTVLPGG